jgi:hypothetical protein
VAVIKVSEETSRLLAPCAGGDAQAKDRTTMPAPPSSDGSAARSSSRSDLVVEPPGLPGDLPGALRRLRATAAHDSRNPPSRSRICCKRRPRIGPTLTLAA